MSNFLRIGLKPHLAVMLALFVGAGIAGALLLPGDAERVAMLERDGNNARALHLLEERFAKGDRSQRTLYLLEQLYQHFGKLDRSREMLELLAQSRPRDLVLQRRLVRFYRDTQDGEAYLAGLSRLVSRKYSEPVCAELISQLRLVGKFVREREAIERCRLKGYRRESDIVRLAELEAVSGDKSKALALLSNVDDVKGLARPGDRLMLSALLLDGGKGGEVARRAPKWIAADAGNPKFGLTLVSFLSNRSAHDVAMQVARETGKPGDSISLAVAELMLERDQTSAASAYLRGWIERSEIKNPELATRFIAAALDAEDPEVALLAARRFGMQNVLEQDLVRIAEALGATGKRDEFELVRAALSSDTLVSHPLLSAMVELNKGAKQSSRALLSGVASDALDTWRLALWARLMRETGDGALADLKIRDSGDHVAGRVHGLAGRGSTRRLARAYKPYSVRALRGRTRVRRGKITSGVARLKTVRKLRSVRRSKFDPGKYVARPKAVSRPMALNQSQ